MSVPFVAEFVIFFPIRRYFLPYFHMRYEELIDGIYYLISIGYSTLHISYKWTLATHKMQRRRNHGLQQNSRSKQYVEN